MRRLSARSSRGLALALLALVLLAAYAVTVAPYRSLYHGGVERIAGLERRLARYHDVAATREAVVARLAAQGADASLAANFLSNETPALALADLQRHVELAVQASSAQLLSTQALPIAESEGGLVAASVRVSLRGDHESIQRLLHRLEGAQPIVHMDNVSLRALARSAAAVARGAHQLEMRFDVTGYLRVVQ